MTDSRKTYRKRRVTAHISEDESFKVVADILPKHWVIREFNKPDYGIDLVIELFEKVDTTNDIFETLGEFIFVQVKSVQTFEPKKVKYHPAKNVAKASYQEDKKYYVETDVIKFTIDTNDLVTIQGMGASISVLLFLVALDSKRLFFLNLNDLIDKVIIPKHPDFHQKKSLTIEIPILNEVDKNDDDSYEPLKFYAKRAKMLPAFSIFLYQKTELFFAFKLFIPGIVSQRVIMESETDYSDKQINEMLLNFILQIEELDIWGLDKASSIKEEVYQTIWAPMKTYHQKLLEMSKIIKTRGFDSARDKENVILLWYWLGNLNSVYQECCREWWAPKFLGLISSYKDTPSIVETE